MLREPGLTLVSLMQLMPRELPRGVTVSTLPRILEDELVRRVPTGVVSGHYYLVPGELSGIKMQVNRLAVPYHDYAVEVLGDRCDLSDCSKHEDLADVVPLFGGGRYR